LPKRRCDTVLLDSPPLDYPSRATIVTLISLGEPWTESGPLGLGESSDIGFPAGVQDSGGARAEVELRDVASVTTKGIDVFRYVDTLTFGTLVASMMIEPE
jgi:hypothetical protein